MKPLTKITIALLGLILAVFLAANLALHSSKNSDMGRPHLVEVSRLARQIDASGQLPNDYSQWEYVYDISICTEEEEFYKVDRDYVIRRIGDRLYRFDYHPAYKSKADILVLNGSLAVITVLLMGVLLYVHNQVLRPFTTLSEIPFELAKGNLTIPLPESKNRYFGRYLWGMDLLRENLEQQKQWELALQKEKQTLLLSLSHDLRTPLSAIKLYAQALSRGLYPDKGKQQQVALNIGHKAGEMEALINQITAAASEDFLNFEVSVTECYLSHVISKVTDYYQDKLSMLKTDLTVSPYTNCLLRADPDRSVEVIQNLMENAIKYGDGTGISVQITQEEDCALITVENGGCTLSPSEVPHIFDSFWRGSNTHNQKGSGLGLYICRQLMHKMNGDIFSQIEGNQFRITAVFPKV